MSRLRNRSWVRWPTENPAMSVPSRSKNAPMWGPAGLPSTSATEPGQPHLGLAHRLRLIGLCGSRASTSSKPSRMQRMNNS